MSAGIPDGEDCPPTLDALFAQAEFTPNEAQRAAIEHVDGPLFLVAGPGSGKTRVLLWRAVNLIVFQGVAPSDIFLSTFTEKAAKQLVDGLITLLGIATEHTGRPYDISAMYVGTLHSLCLRLLQDRALASGRERVAVPSILDALDQYFELASASFWRAARERLAHDGEIADLRKALNAHFEPPTSASRHKTVVNLQSLFNRLSEENLDPSALLALDLSDERPLFELYALYCERLGNRRVDLALLQQAAYRLLTSEGVKRNRFRHVIIDEYQDTNAIQEKVIFRLAEKTGNLCVVGDDDQALYRFRGATVENFVQFPARVQTALGMTPRRIELNINYRSRHGIVAAYTRFIEGGDWRTPEGVWLRLHDKGICANSTDDGIAVVASSPSAPDQVADEVAGLVKALITTGAVTDANQVAFLFPSLKSTPVERFEKALNAVGLKVYAPRAKRFLEADEPTLVVGLLGLVIGRPPRDAEFDRGEYHEFHAWLDGAEARAKAAVAADFGLKLFLADRKAELDAIKADHAALTKVLEKEKWSDEVAYSPDPHKRALLAASGLSASARRALGGVGLDKLVKERREAGTPVTLRSVLNRATTADWGLLDLFYRFLGFEPLRGQLDLADGGKDEGPACNLSLTSQLLARYADTFPALITGFGLATGALRAGFYHAFLFALFRLAEGEYEDAEDPFPRGRIPFLTIHQSKGLEFPVVVLGSARSRRSVRRVEQIVRPFLPPGGEPLDRMGDLDAMRMFYVALSRAKNLLILAHPKGVGQTVCEELRPLLDNRVTRIPDFDPSTVPVAKEDTSEIARRYSYTTDYLGYLRCPRQYMLFRRYGFAASRTQTMFFGSLVHATLEDLHHRLIATRAQNDEERR